MGFDGDTLVYKVPVSEPSPLVEVEPELPVYDLSPHEEIISAE